MRYILQFILIGLLYASPLIAQPGIRGEISELLVEHQNLSGEWIQIRIDQSDLHPTREGETPLLTLIFESESEKVEVKANIAGEHLLEEPFFEALLQGKYNGFNRNKVDQLAAALTLKTLEALESPLLDTGKIEAAENSWKVSGQHYFATPKAEDWGFLGWSAGLLGAMILAIALLTSLNTTLTLSSNGVARLSSWEVLKDDFQQLLWRLRIGRKSNRKVVGTLGRW